MFRFPGEVSHETCNETRRAFIGALSRLYVMSNEQAARKELHGVINRWFSHTGFQNLNHDEELAEKLARIIFVVVSLRGDDYSGIECRARIMTFNAPSEPLG